jgi:hypothetical protein
LLRRLRLDRRRVLISRAHTYTVRTCARRVGRGPVFREATQ